MINSVSILFLLTIVFSSYGDRDSTTIGKREPFTIDLIKLSTGDDADNPFFKSVRIELKNEEEYAVISRLDDLLMKQSNKSVTKTVYYEPPLEAQYLSTFEAQQNELVVASLKKTLQEFDDLIKNKQWGRCLYLDAYFPRFMSCFYYLGCAFFNSLDALPHSANITDSLYDVSLRSTKSDKRIQSWSMDDNAIKLRIITKELVYQFDEWNHAVKKNKRKINGFTQSLQTVYGLFVSRYFALATDSHLLPTSGRP